MTLTFWEQQKSRKARKCENENENKPKRANKICMQQNPFKMKIKHNLLQHGTKESTKKDCHTETNNNQ